ncbi:amidase signature enzyme [Panus rudis PR-1116 ss-1]|nr:amidase signature enzyme [Panus rudis PR-1116 ss-1]
MFLTEYFAHRRACAAKQEERRARIQSLGPQFHAPLSSSEKFILQQSVASTVSSVKNGTLDPVDVLTAFSKKALKAHEATNCLTEILISKAVDWAKNCNKDGALAGMPVSLKDTAAVAGFDACIGYSAWTFKPMQKDSALVRLLKDAGAVPFVKTNIPITLLSFESTNDVFGRSTNPHGKGFAPGGSTGGEAALLAYGGSRIGIGTDVAGSVRAPAHYSGIYTIKASMHRFLKAGNPTSIPGQIGIPAVYSPMTRTLEDLETFWKAVVEMKPWEYDYSCIPLPWREVNLKDKQLKFGVIWDDGVVAPSPACRRALKEVVSVLQSKGHRVVEIDPPSPYEALRFGSQLLLADAGKIATKPIRPGEFNEPGVETALRGLRYPKFLKKLYAWYLRYIRRDEVYAGLVEGWHEKSVEEYYGLVAQREAYRSKWFDMWNEEKLDFVLTVPNALPAVPHGGMNKGFKTCGYTFLFNVLDYSAGVLPVTHVDSYLDQLPSFTPRNQIEAEAYRMYDAKAMHGLPVGVQVVGRRLQEEHVLEAMKIIEGLLKETGKAYNLLETDD